MPTISSPGIGSGLDIKSIVSQLAALEKASIPKLQMQVATAQTKISAFGQMKSMASTLSDAAGTLNSLTTWNSTAIKSADTSYVTATVVGGTPPTSFSVQVQSLAQPQDYASAPLLPVGGAVGAGTLTITLGKHTQASAGPPVVAASFAAGTATPVNITVTASNTLSDVATSINSANAGVTASILNDASGERLLLRSKATGEVSGFRLSVADSDGVNTDASGLSRVVTGSSITQYASDAKATINGIAVSSSTNTFANVVSGVTLTAVKATTSAVGVTVSKDTAGITTAINSFVKAYNALNDNLNELTKYDPATQSGAVLQGDSTAITLQSGLRNLLQSGSVGSAFKRLGEIGVSAQLGGNLAVDSTKLSAALDSNFDDVKNLFRIDNSNKNTNGVALKFKDFTKSLLDSNGFFATKSDSLNKILVNTNKNINKVNASAARVEAELTRKYSALDTKVSSINALNSYVSQQVAQWNKSSN